MNNTKEVKKDLEVKVVDQQQIHQGTNQNKKEAIDDHKEDLETKMKIECEL